MELQGWHEYFYKKNKYINWKSLFLDAEKNDILYISLHLTIAKATYTKISLFHTRRLMEKLWKQLKISKDFHNSKWLICILNKFDFKSNQCKETVYKLTSAEKIRKTIIRIFS